MDTYTHMFSWVLGFSALPGFCSVFSWFGILCVSLQDIPFGVKRGNGK